MESITLFAPLLPSNVIKRFADNLVLASIPVYVGQPIKQMPTEGAMEG